MRLVSFQSAGGGVVAGLLPADAPRDGGDFLGRVIDLSHPSLAGLLDGVEPTVMALVASDLSRWIPRLDPLAKAPERCDAAAVVALRAEQLRAPLPRPGKVVGAAFNYVDGLKERNMPPPAAPVLFVRSGDTVIGPRAPIPRPPDVGELTYEAELAVVIGRRALNVSIQQAMRHVAGYTIHNDVSATGLVKADGGNFVRGKNLPGSGPLGPWLATPDEIADPHRVAIRLDIDGRRLQDGNTADLLFDIPALIAHASRWLPLEAGDVIATGTPAGVAVSHSPPAWLREGQWVTITLEGLGSIANPVASGGTFLEQ